MLKSRKMMITVFAVVIIAIIGMIGLEVYAADNPINLDITGINQQSDANQTTANQIATNQETANSTIIQPTTNTSTNNESTLPKTGVTEDITVMFFIVVCAISAIYAYKKIRDYKA